MIHRGAKTYTEILDVGENLIVESEVVAWDNIDTGLLLDVPVFQTESLTLSEELSLGELACPVTFSGLLQLTEGTHARETEDGSARKVMLAYWYEEEVCNRRYSRLNHDGG